MFLVRAANSLLRSFLCTHSTYRRSGILMCVTLHVLAVPSCTASWEEQQWDCSTS